MDLTFKQIKAGQRVMLGRILEKHSYQGSDIIQLSDQKFYARKGGGEIPNVDRRPYVEVYQVEDTTCMLYLTNHSYSTIEPVNVPDDQIKALRAAAAQAAQADSGGAGNG